MQLFEANGYYFVFTIKLQSNKNIFNISLQDLTNLYQQKDLKLSLSRVFWCKDFVQNGYLVKVTELI
jgi:hypothetical protein